MSSMDKFQTHHKGSKRDLNKVVFGLRNDYNGVSNP